MIHTISNKYLTVEILSRGVEISSIRSGRTGKEYMWNGDPDIWGSQAPVLFPVIGSLKNNECKIDGTSYNIPKHGFIRHNDEIELKGRTADKLEFQLEHSEKSLAIYPFKFSFRISFALEESKLKITHVIKNLDSRTMHFSLGAHPGFKCPVNEGESYEDYYLEFEEKENANTTLLSKNGLITDQTRQMFNDSNILTLTKDLFNDDALIFKHLNSRKVRLKSNRSDQILTVSFKDFKYLGVWAKPGAPFICIEPWLGIADHEQTTGEFLEKDGLISLEPGNDFTAFYTIEIED